MPIDPADVVFEAFSGKGNGGQHRNRHYCCIRATHTPTGVTAVAVSERKQSQNKKAAVAALEEKLARISGARLQARKNARRIALGPAGFGARYVRTYRIDGPDAGVVDHATGTRWPAAKVLAGGIDALLQLRLRGEGGDECSDSARSSSTA